MNYATPFSRTLPRFVTTHNPFYLISAALVLYGFTQTNTPESVTAGWLLMSLLGGYTLLVALTGWAIVRFGQVWDDARTILLIVVLLLLALSNCFDHVALKDPRPGAAFLVGGLCFAIALSEGLLRALQIRLSLPFRTATYSLLALFYVHPIWLALLSVHGRNAAMNWGVYLFPGLASLFLLMYLPAAHREDDRVPNGAPWRWPWYPWSVVAVLLVGLILRSYSLSMAFEPTRGTATSWRAYFLVPMLLAAFAVFFELARATKNRRLEQFAAISPAGLLLLSFPGPGHTPVDARFLQMLSLTAGSPVQITLVGLLGFYTIVWLRGLRRAEAGVLGCLALLALVDRRTLDLDSLRLPDTTTFELLAVLQIGIGLWANSSWRVLVGILLVLTSLTLRGQDAWFTSNHGFYPLHLALLLTLTVALAFNDPLARAIRRIAWGIIPFAALFAAFSYDALFPGVPAFVRHGYVALLTVASGFSWHHIQAVPQLAAALLTTSANLAAHTRQVYLALAASELSRALPYLVWGLLLLIVAALISLWKGGVVNRCWLSLERLNDVLATRRTTREATTIV